MNFDPKLDVRVQFKCGNGFIGNYFAQLETLAMLCYMLDHEDLVHCYYVSWAGSSNVMTSKGLGFSEVYPKWIQTVEVARTEFSKKD